MLEEDYDFETSPSQNEERRRLLSSSQRNRNSFGCADSVNGEEGLRLQNWRESTEKEKEFLRYVLSGDLAGVTNFLNSNPNFDVNSPIELGSEIDGPQTALHLAVSRGDMSMTELLLGRPNIDLGDASLVAAHDGRISLTLMLLDCMMYKEGPQAEDRGCPGSQNFPDDITPLMLAATQGHVGLIRHLLRRHHRIKQPHSPNCNCKAQCRIPLDPKRGLRASFEKLRIYTALSSPAYICVSADDPILRAFQLYQEIEVCARRSVALDIAYHNLAVQVRAFAVDMLACCRDNFEVDTMLSRKQGHSKVKCDAEMPRLILAMQYEQKEFVAHSAAQHVLYTRWIGESPDWSKLPLWKVTLRVVARVPMLPVLAVINICAPNTACARRMASPVNRFVNHVAAYLVFLALVFYQANLNKKNATKQPTSSGLELVIISFLVGNEFGFLRLIRLQGFKRFFGRLWHCYDVVTIQMFWLWFWSWHMATHYLTTGMERKFWPPTHPALVADCLLAVATILAFGRLLFLCQLHPRLGPLQVSLGQMTSDLMQCFILFVIVLASFAAGLGTLFQYYDGMVQEQPGTGALLSQPASFVDTQNTLKTLFWGVFGLTPPEYTTVVIENLPDHAVNSHYLTERVGASCFALYMLLTNIVILNVLVAKMTNTYQRVASNIDIEWKFSKSEVYLTYMQETVMPPPLNLIPTWSGLKSAFLWVKSIVLLMRKKHKPLIYEDEVLEDMRYYQLMDALTQRYLRTFGETQKAPAEPSPTPDSTRLAADTAKENKLDSRQLADVVVAQIMPVLQQQLSAFKDELQKPKTADTPVIRNKKK